MRNFALPKGRGVGQRAIASALKPPTCTKLGWSLPFGCQRAPCSIVIEPNETNFPFAMSSNLAGPKVGRHVGRSPVQLMDRARASSGGPAKERSVAASPTGASITGLGLI